MANYRVMARPGDVKRVDILLLREGANWWAGLFGMIWALINRMWLVFVLLLAISLAIGTLPEAQAFILSLALTLVLLVFGNDLKLWSLKRRGFEEIAEIRATSQEEAEIRFYSAFAPPPAPANPELQTGAGSTSKNW